MYYRVRRVNGNVFTCPQRTTLPSCSVWWEATPQQEARKTSGQNKSPEGGEKKKFAGKKIPAAKTQTELSSPVSLNAWGKKSLFY